jgi:Calx-beta domain-containing protein/centrosomal CEP192-like protein
MGRISTSNGTCVNTRGGRSLTWRARMVALMFGLLVLPAAADAGFLDIEWTAPTTNADGSSLIDLASYRVYTGSSTPACPATNFQTLAAPESAPPSGETVAATLTNLTAGTTYWVRVSAVDSSGNESDCTPAVSGVAHTEVDATPSALSFGSVTIGTTSTLNFTVQNLSATTLTGTVTTATPFSIVSGGALNVAPGAAQSVRVQFTPTAAQVYGGSVTFATSGDDLTRSVSGTGVAALTPAVLQFSQTAYTVKEGGSATITVIRMDSTNVGVTVDYTTAGGTATAGVDYTAASGTLTFAPGVTSQAFSVSTARDKSVETAETITLTLRDPQGGAVLDTATLTVNDSTRGKSQR